MNKVLAEEWVNNKVKYNDFFITLTEEERCRLLKDQEFREFLCDNHTDYTFYYFVNQLSTNEIDMLFDKNYMDLVWSFDNKYFFNVLYSAMNRDKLNHFLSNCKVEDIQIYSLDEYFFKLDDENKFRVLDYMFFGMNDFDGAQIGAMMNYLYSVSYAQNIDNKDLSKNSAQIKWISEKLQDKELVKKFVETKSIMLALDPENCYKIYENVDFDSLSYEGKNIVVDLLYNNDMCKSKLPKNILENKSFIKFISERKDWSEYKQIMDAIKDMDILSYDKIDQYRKTYVDDYISKFMDIKDEEDYYEFEGESRHHFYNFKDAIFQRYFKSYAIDVYMSACVILDAINTLPGYKEKMSKDGCELIERLVVLFCQETKDEEFDFKFSENFGKIDDRNIQNVYNIQEIVKVLETRDDWGDMFNKALKQARNMFSKNLSSVIYDPAHNQGGQIIDITKMSNFKLLVHDQTVREGIEPISSLPEELSGQNISMSLLDNNHLRTYLNCESSVVFGYSNIEPDSIIHALPEDSFTHYCTSDPSVQKELTKKAITNYLPSYIDINSFMKQTRERGYNEIKVQARKNSVDKNGEAMFMPSYILCRDSIRDIDKQMADFYKLPIVYIDTKNVVKNPETVGYEPYLHKIMGAYTRVSLKDSSVLV